MKTIFALSFGVLLGIFLVPTRSLAMVRTGKDLLTGREVRFPSQENRTPVIVFLSAKCPCSQSHEPELKRLHARFAGSGFEFIGVHSNQDETLADSKKHFKAAALPFPVIEDRGAKLADEFRALKTPHVFVLKGSEVVFQGGVDDSADGARAKKRFLEDALSSLQLGKPLEVSRARALGCAIQR
jgi:hypothetical protein